MKKLLTLLLTLLAADICAAEKPLIRIHTDQTDLLYRIDDQGRLCQSYLGPAFRNPEDLRLLPAGDEAFTTYGSKNYFTPALRLTHNDGNGSCSSPTYRTKPALRQTASPRPASCSGTRHTPSK